MNIEIKHGSTNNVLCSFDAESLKDCVNQAVKRGVSLYGAALRGANLRGANLRGANLRGADLRGANLRGANLFEADLRGASLYRADLRDANLFEANLCDANLCGANLYRADLRGAALRGANLRGADLYGEKLAIAPLIISGLTWEVYITESYLKIGCQRHTHDAWKNFSNEEIYKMESRAIEFLNQNKLWLLEACKAHRKESLEFRKIVEVAE